MALATAWVLTTSTAWAQVRVVDADQVQIGRYSTQASEPPAELADPLAVFAQLSYPRQAVESVGAALNYTLMRTGYQLADLDTLTPAARAFLQLPLPESQRRMGPYQVKTILETLIGSAWTLHTDPVTRTVWLTLATDPVQAPQARSDTTNPAGAAPRPSETTNGLGTSTVVDESPRREQTLVDVFRDPYIN